MAVRYLAIEGPPCVGKTELARLLGRSMKARLVLEEAEENPFLPLFYENPEHYGFQTQVFFMLHRYRQQQDLHQMDLFESTVVSNYLFARSGIYAHVCLNDAELSLYERMAETLHEKVPSPDLVIYLHNSTDSLLQRVRKQTPSYERLMTESYLARLVEAYTHFFFHYTESPLLIINVSQVDFVRNPAGLEELLQQVKAPPAGTRYYRPSRMEA